MKALNFDSNFVLFGRFNLNVLDRERLSSFPSNRRLAFDDLLSAVSDHSPMFNSLWDPLDWQSMTSWMLI